MALLLPAAVAAAPAPALAPAPEVTAHPFDQAPLDAVLQAYVDSTGRVDYAGLQADRAGLDAYVDSLGQVSPRSAPARFATRADELAYWINAYNAFVLRGVVDAWPVASVKDIALLNGFFNRVEFTAGGQALTLDDLENKIIRPVYREPRIHAAINCGAVSCPPLARSAYRGATLEAQLETAFRRFAGDPQYVRLTPQGRLQVSKILDWFGQDFVEWFPEGRRPAARAPTLVDYLLPYLSDATAAFVRQHPDLPVTFDDYDWHLNAQAPAD